MKKTLAVLVPLTLLLAACSSGDDETTQVSSGVDTAATMTETDVSNETTVAATDVALGSGRHEDPKPTTDEPVEAADDAAEDTADGAVADGGAQPVGGGFSLNGFRYCEVLITVDGDDGAPLTEVWGTQGVGPCSDEAWYALDPEALMAEFEATGIHMNGPRYFVVDGAVDTAAPAETNEPAPEREIRDFGGIGMRLLATLGDDTKPSGPYSPVRVVRTITWTFNAGSEIYELTDPEGVTYVMQSYSLIHDPNLTADDLASLGDRFALPAGWTYSARTLDEHTQIALDAEGGAIVIQDELENTYQRN